MPMSRPTPDIYFTQLCEPYSETDRQEIERYLSDWSAGTYTSSAHSVLDHAMRKGIEPLKYLRQAHNFNRKRAKRVPPTGYRRDSSAVYRKEGEYLIVHPDSSGAEKVVSFGSLEE
jgi:redox-sensitive bicupin YhaK (pirin superfamily)